MIIDVTTNLAVKDVFRRVTTAVSNSSEIRITENDTGVLIHLLSEGFSQQRLMGNRVQPFVLKVEGTNEGRRHADAS